MALLRKSLFIVLSPAMALCLMALDFPDNPPIPEPRPQAGEAQAGDNAQAAGEETAEEKAEGTPPVPEERAENPPPPDPVPPTEETGAFARCTAALTALGAQYEALETVDDAGQCGIDRPLKVTAVMEGVGLSPDGIMRCETALALARWAKDYVEPTARIALSDDIRLSEVRQASTYVCRSRNNVSGARISEHAKGNAVDIRSLTFSDGTTVDMEPRLKDGSATGAFQRTISAAACLYFTTVLSPGSDATHQDHMHLDVIQRNRGYRYCR